MHKNTVRLPSFHEPTAGRAIDNRAPIRLMHGISVPYRAGIMGPKRLFCAGAEQASMPGFADSSRNYVDAISLTDPAALLVGGHGVDVVEVVLNAAGTTTSSNRAGRPTAQDRGGCPRGKNTKLSVAAPKASRPQRMDSSPSRT
jgi:hypothetical protein